MKIKCLALGLTNSCSADICFLPMSLTSGPFNINWHILYFMTHEPGT